MNDIKDTFYEAITCVFVLCLIVIVVAECTGNKETAMYNCSIAEISPDIPIQARELCRQVNAEVYRKEHTK
jgi:hypothetical protein